MNRVGASSFPESPKEQRRPASEGIWVTFRDPFGVAAESTHPGPFDAHQKLARLIGRTLGQTKLTDKDWELKRSSSAVCAWGVFPACADLANGNSGDHGSAFLGTVRLARKIQETDSYLSKKIFDLQLPEEKNSIQDVPESCIRESFIGN